MARGGIRLVHGHTKSTLITYFSGMKIDPNYAFLKAFFLNLSIMSFSKYVYMTKNTPFFPILHVFAPLNAVRAYSGWSWKTTLITWIFGRAWYPPWHSSGPPGANSQGNLAINITIPWKTWIAEHITDEQALLISLGILISDLKFTLLISYTRIYQTTAQKGSSLLWWNLQINWWISSLMTEKSSDFEWR